MIVSMTGFGAGHAERDGARVVSEVRTINHRFLDVHVRIARDYAHLESEIVQAVRKGVLRGRVDVSVSIHRPSAAEVLLDLARQSRVIAPR